MSETILKLSHLQKGYRNFPVLKDVSFQLSRGHILGLIGKNGAGKTTMMKTILGLNRGYQGQIEFDGAPLKTDDPDTRKRIGSLVDVIFYEDMSARRNLKLLAMLDGVLSPKEANQKIDELLDFVGLSG